MIITPPHYDPTMPGLSIPCLASSLQNAGYDVIIRDLNVEFFDKLLTKKELTNKYAKFQERRLSFKFLNYQPINEDELITKKDFLINSIESAKNNLRNPSHFYDYKSYRQSFEIIDQCLELASLPYYKTQLLFNDFKTLYLTTSTDQILKAVQDNFCNPYIEFYKTQILKEIRSQNLDVIGISINLNSQVIPGLTLAFMLKQMAPNIHIVVGGSYFTLLEENLKNNLKIFSLFDSVVLNEGETAIIRLVECLEKGLSLQNVPNLIYKDNAQILISQGRHIEDINKLTTPSFEGLPLSLYFSPQLILPMYMTRGCYWGKCAFCCFCNSDKSTLRVRNSKYVKEDMDVLSLKYQCATFMYLDEAIPPKDMVKLGDELLNTTTKYNWAVHARFEKQFDENLCLKLANAGCRYLKFGLESGNDRMLALMNKGINLDQVKQILDNANKAGIVTIISIFFGFPTETLAEAQDTVDFVLDNIDKINFTGSDKFILFKNTKVYNNPEKYKINKIFNNIDDLETSYKYSTETGMTIQEIDKIYHDFVAKIEKLTPLFINIFHILLYSAHFNSNKLQKELILHG